MIPADLRSCKRHTTHQKLGEPQKNVQVRPLVLVCLQLVVMLTVYKSVLSSDHPRDEVKVTQPLNCSLIAMKGIRKKMTGAS